MGRRAGRSQPRLTKVLAQRICEMRRACDTWEIIAEKVGINRATIRNWRESRDWFGQMIEDADSGRLGTMSELAERATARHLKDVGSGATDRINANLVLGLLRTRHPELREHRDEQRADKVDAGLVKDIVGALRPSEQESC